eukprot:45058-Eustigmatos_ZCMA.PRE.1
MIKDRTLVAKQSPSYIVQALIGPMLYQSQTLTLSQHQGYKRLVASQTRSWHDLQHKRQGQPDRTR